MDRGAGGLRSMGHKESDKTEQLTLSGGFPGGSHSKESACMQGTWDHSLGEEEIPWRREWQPTPVLPGKSHGQRGLADYSPWSHIESDMTE